MGHIRPPGLGFTMPEDIKTTEEEFFVDSLLDAVSLQKFYASVLSETQRKIRKLCYGVIKVTLY